MYSSSNNVEYKWWQIMWNRKSFKNAYSWKRQLNNVTIATCSNILLT